MSTSMRSCFHLIHQASSRVPRHTGILRTFVANLSLGSHLKMPRNVEIKARVENFDELKKRAVELSNDEGLLLKQEDTFFKVPNGRLKLRQYQGKKSVLVQYNRSDKEGPKLSDFILTDVEDDVNLKTSLSNALGVLGVVKKERLLVMCGQTRVHLDQVDGLGHFMELEVVLRDEQTVEEGQKIAEGLMKDLNIQQSSLIDCAYMDLILKGKDKES